MSTMSSTTEISKEKERKASKKIREREWIKMCGRERGRGRERDSRRERKLEQCDRHKSTKMAN